MMKNLTLEKIMWHKYPLVVVVFLFSFLVLTCVDVDLNKPVKVDVEFYLEQNPLTISYLTFNKAIIAFDKVRFYGVRDVGNDVVFSSRPGFPFGTFTIPAMQNTSYITYFDIPQGVYNLMRWDIELMEIDDDIYDDEYVDSDDFGLIFEGTYTRLNGETILFFIAVDPALLSFETVNAIGNNSIVLDSKKDYTVTIELNPYLAMQGIARNFLEQAETDSEDDVEFLEISSDSNEELYSLVLFRLEKTFKAVIR
jgi:hypothetical protein